MSNYMVKKTVVKQKSHSFLPASNSLAINSPLLLPIPSLPMSSPFVNMIWFLYLWIYSNTLIVVSFNLLVLYQRLRSLLPLDSCLVMWYYPSFYWWYCQVFHLFLHLHPHSERGRSTIWRLYRCQYQHSYHSNIEFPQKESITSSFWSTGIIY